MNSEGQCRLRVPTKHFCLAPPPPSSPRRLRFDEGAWDTHVHVVGKAEVHPVVADAHYEAPEASIDALVDMLDTVGPLFAVLVQPSIYGTDNRLLLDALRAFPTRFRGVAAIDPGCSETDFQELAESGVRGLRVMGIFGGGVGLDHLETLSARCREVGWHVDLALDPASCSAMVPRLLRLSVPFVVDHMGMCPVAEGVRSDAFQALLYLLRNADCWIKLSAPYRLTGSVSSYADTIPMVAALVEARPERLIWGSDWPHVAIYEESAMPQVSDLVDLVADWVPDPVLRRQIMTINPATLYGAFSGAGDTREGVPR